ncbi:unnamed protein product [Closterium sp. NIES-64]|nr:unnamed protein product [Closterium sp. NIES-64]
MYHSQLRWERKRDKAAAVRPPTERSAAKEAMARAMLGEIEEHDERQHERGHPLERRWVYPWEEDDERPAVYAEQEEIWLPAEREEESVDKKREDFGWLEEAIERQRRREREEREFGYIGFALMAATKETASVTETAGSGSELAKRSAADESRPMGNRGGRLRGQVGGEFAAGWAGVQGDGGGGTLLSLFSSLSLLSFSCFPLTLSRPSPLPFSLFPHLLSSPFAYSPTSPTSFPSGAFLASLPGGSRGSSLRPWSAAPHHPPQPHLATLLATSALLSTSPNVPYQEHFLSRSLVAAGVLLFALALLLLHVSHNPHFATLLANSPFLPPSPHLFHRPSHHKPFLSRSLVAAGGLLFSLGLLLIPLRASPILSLSSSLYHLPPGAFLESLPGGSRGSALFPWSASPSRLPQPPLCQPACNA